MVTWITIGIIVYIAIGIGMLIWLVTTDTWGGFYLYVWWLIVFFYPFLLVRKLFKD